MLQYARGVEIRHKRRSRLSSHVGLVLDWIVEDGVLEVFGRVEVLIYGVDLGSEGAHFRVTISRWTKAVPERLEIVRWGLMWGKEHLRPG